MRRRGICNLEPSDRDAPSAKPRAEFPSFRVDRIISLGASEPDRDLAACHARHTEALARADG